MTSGLQQLSEEAEKVQLEEEARQAKRPRKAETVDDDMAEVSAPSSALRRKGVAAFCNAWAVMTELYPVRRALPLPPQSCLQWNHTILDDPDFLAPWQATPKCI